MKKKTYVKPRGSKKPKFIGLKKHTHAERTTILRKKVVPILREKLGNNLIAIAADGSYARAEDTDFSDIELMIFVKAKKNLPHGFGRIVNGMLVEGLFMTEEEYYKTTIEPNEYWFLSGSDKLEAITNPAFIKKVGEYKVKRLSEKCLKCAHDMLTEIQESFGKLFNALKKKNRENIFLLFSETVMQVLKLMAFINKTPYKTMSTFITQAKDFAIKPTGFDEFIQLATNGKYPNLKILEERSRRLFSGIEELLTKKMGANIYDSDLNTIVKKKF